MIYFAKPPKGQEDHNIVNFFKEGKNLSSYLVLVTVVPGDEMLLAKQIHRQKLESINWLIATIEDLREILYPKFYQGFVLMELTMTENKDDVLMASCNWEQLRIKHEPRTAPFDRPFIGALNELLDQALYYYHDQISDMRKRFDQLFRDIVLSGMIKLQPNPKKVMGQ